MLRSTGTAAARMPARGHEHVAAVAADVDAGADASGAVRDGDARVCKPQVPAPAASSRFERRREGAVLALQACERLLATVRGVDVDDDHAGTRRCGTGSDPDVGVRPLPPPASDRASVRGRLVQSVSSARVLADARAVGVAAAASTCVGVVAGQYWPVASGEAEGDGASAEG